jgi:hypothetical protein
MLAAHDRKWHIASFRGKRSNSVAFGVKRTSTSRADRTGFMSARPSTTLGSARAIGLNLPWQVGLSDCRLAFLAPPASHRAASRQTLSRFRAPINSERWPPLPSTVATSPGLVPTRRRAAKTCAGGLTSSSSAAIRNSGVRTAARSIKRPRARNSPSASLLRRKRSSTT